MYVMIVSLEMIRQARNPFSKKRDLDFRTAGISFGSLEFCNNFLLLRCCQRHKKYYIILTLLLQVAQSLTLPTSGYPETVCRTLQDKKSLVFQRSCESEGIILGEICSREIFYRVCRKEKGIISFPVKVLYGINKENIINNGFSEFNILIVISL